MKFGAPTETEAEGTKDTPSLGRLRTRPVQVSSSSDSIASTPLRSLAIGAEVIGCGAGIVYVDGAKGIGRHVPVATALCLARRSANFLFLSSLRRIPV